jgi:tellurite resistance protein TerC
MTDLGSPVAWVAFLVFVLVMLALDLGLLQRRAHTPTTREALGWSLMWIALACVFGGWVAWQSGAETASEYFTAYVVEKSLSVDNLFVFVLVFGAMKIPDQVQHRVLFWGILGALILRAGMIFAGTALLHQFHWLIYAFGGLLVVGGLRLFWSWRTGEEEAPTEGRLFKWVRKYLPMAPELDGQRFFTRVKSPGLERGVLRATPLLGALVLVELSDVVFALDSIPAVLAISQDPFIVFTSNVFAILGLRSLYFLLARILHHMQELKIGLAAVLVFVGIKMLLSDVVHVPAEISLPVILGLLGVPALIAWWRRR